MPKVIHFTAFAQALMQMLQLGLGLEVHDDFRMFDMHHYIIPRKTFYSAPYIRLFPRG